MKILSCSPAAAKTPNTAYLIKSTAAVRNGQLARPLNLRLDNYHLAGVHAPETGLFLRCPTTACDDSRWSTPMSVGAPWLPPLQQPHRLCAVQLRADYVHQWRGPICCPSCSKTCNFNYDQMARALM